MEKLQFTPTDTSPNILLDPSSGQFTFSGISLLEDVVTFYGPVMRWLSRYHEAPAPDTEVTFEMEYFNTSSSKVMLDIMQEIEKLQQAGNSTRIIWKYQSDDEDMEWAGQEYAELIDVPFVQEPLTPNE